MSKNVDLSVWDRGSETLDAYWARMLGHVSTDGANGIMVDTDALRELAACRERLAAAKSDLELAKLYAARLGDDGAMAEERAVRAEARSERLAAALLLVKRSDDGCPHCGFFWDATSEQRQGDARGCDCVVHAALAADDAAGDAHGR